MNSNIISDNSKSKNTEQKQSVDYEKALNTYYKMKHNYEKEVKDKVENIRQSLRLDEGIVFRKINLKKAKKEMQDFKAKCQNCKRKVGMIFTTTFNKENLTPVINCLCGDTTSPCNLNISLETGTIEPLQDIILDETKDIDEYKEKIIIDKNKLLFGFLTSDKVLDNYEKYKEELNMSFERFDFYFQDYHSSYIHLNHYLQLELLYLYYLMRLKTNNHLHRGAL
jgi:Cu2+-containing amine oxidase